MRLRFTASIGSDYGRSSHISPKVCSFQSNPTRLTFNLIDFPPINWLFSVADNGDTKWKKRARNLYTLCASVFEERGRPSGLSSGEYLKSTRRRLSAPPVRQRTGISTQHRIPDTINQSGSHDWLCTCTRWREKAIDAASGSDEGKESNSVRWEREINECARMNKKKGPGAISRRQETQMGVVGDSGLPPSCRPSLHTRTDPAGSCAVALLCVHASLCGALSERERAKTTRRSG